MLPTLQFWWPPLIRLRYDLWCNGFARCIFSSVMFVLLGFFCCLSLLRWDLVGSEKWVCLMSGDEKLRIKEHHLSWLIGSSQAMLPFCNSEAKPSKPLTLWAWSKRTNFSCLSDRVQNLNSKTWHAADKPKKGLLIFDLKRRSWCSNHYAYRKTMPLAVIPCHSPHAVCRGVRFYKKLRPEIRTWRRNID